MSFLSVENLDFSDHLQEEKVCIKVALNIRSFFSPYRSKEGERGLCTKPYHKGRSLSDIITSIQDDVTGYLRFTLPSLCCLHVKNDPVLKVRSPDQILRQREVCP